MSHLHGPRARFNELISQIITSQDIDGSELLIVIGMLRERTLREEFLDCLHTKAPYFRLSMLSYNHLLDVMRALLREANNSGDFKSIAAVFTTSRLYGRSSGGFIFTIMKSLPSHEVWSNIPFWIFCTDELISEDIARWDDVSSSGKRFLGLHDSQVHIFLAINRIHAVAFGSMMTVGATTTVLRSYLEAAAESYGLEPAKIDLSKPPCEEFVVWLLDTLIEQQSKNKKRNNKEPSNGVEGIAMPSKIDTRTRRVGLGYSSLQELVFQAAEKTRKRSNTDDYLCMCGLPLGVWQPLGLFDERVAQRKEVSSILCEACFRQATAPLHTMATIIGDTGRCVVPNTLPRKPDSFLAIYYGHQASLNKYRGTTGEHVDMSLLSSEKLLSQVSEQNSFLRSEKKGMSAVRGRSNKYANKKGEGDGTSRTTSTQSELEVSDDESLVSDLSESEGAKGLQGISLLDDKASQQDDINRVALSKFIALMQSGVDVVKISNSPITRHITRTLFLDRPAQRLCWLPPGRAQLVPEEGRFVPIHTIQSIRLGSEKFEKCISIVAEKKTLFLKIEETKLREQVVEGLLLICDLNRDKKKKPKIASSGKK